MDFFLSRYRNLTVLLLVIVAQLLLIAYQVKSNKDVALIRVWAVTAVTPVEQGLELVRHYTWGFVEDYFVLLHVRSQNEKLQHENGQLKIENHYLKSELATAPRPSACSRRIRLRKQWLLGSSGTAPEPIRKWCSWIAVPPAESRAAWR